MKRRLRPAAAVLAAPAVAAALLATVPVQAEAVQEPVDREMIERIEEEGMERSQAMEVFHTLTNLIGPRLSNSPAYVEAAEWTRDWLASRDLENVHLEPFEFGRGWSQQGQTLALVAPRYAPLMGYAEAWTPSTSGPVEDVPIYVGDLSAQEIRALGSDLRGAILLANRPQTVFTRADRPQPTESDGPVRTGAPSRADGELSDSETPLGEIRTLATEGGAAAILLPSRGEHGTVFVRGNRNTPDDAVPTLVLAAEHYNLLVRMVESEARPVVRVEVRSRYHEESLESHNVLADLPGTDPELRDELVVIGAHLDSWHAGTGATDNADGVAVVMEAMRILRALDARPRRTIRVALWGGEEQGLHGSRRHVGRHFAGAQNAAAHERVSVYLNDDPGGGPIYGWYMEENEAAKAIFDAWLEPLAHLGTRRNVIQGLPSTDHLAFLQEGIPGFSAIKDYENYDTRTHHTNQDTFERIREEDLKQSAVVMAVFAWHAAMRDERIPREEDR